MKSVSSYKGFIKNLVIIFIIIFFIGRCRKGDNPATRRSASNIKLKAEWVQLGDSKGKIDILSDSAVVEVVEFSKDENFLVSGSAWGKEIIVWDLEDKKEKLRHHFPKKVECATFSSDNKFLFAGGEFSYLIIWETKNWSVHKIIPLTKGIEGMCLSNGGNLLAAGREDGIILLIDLKNFTVQDSLLHGLHGKTPEYNNSEYRADVNALDFSPNDDYLVSAGFDGDIKIWFLEDKKLIKTICAHNSSIKSVKINSQGTCIASASSGLPYEGDNSIKIWDFKSGNLLHKLSSPMGMEAVEFTPSGEFLLGGARELIKNQSDTTFKDYIYIYYIPEDFFTEPIRLINKEPILLSEYLYFNHMGNKLVSGHEDGSVRLWDVTYQK